MRSFINISFFLRNGSVNHPIVIVICFDETYLYLLPILDQKQKELDNLNTQKLALTSQIEALQTQNTDMAKQAEDNNAEKDKLSLSIKELEQSFKSIKVIKTVKI